jgi:hypothetical protein
LKLDDHGNICATAKKLRTLHPNGLHSVVGTGTVSLVRKAANYPVEILE